MNYEQFYYWLEGLLEGQKDTSLKTIIIKKMEELKGTNTLGTMPMLPDIGDYANDYTASKLEILPIAGEKEMEQFIANFENIPVEEEGSIPIVGKDPIEDGSKGQWEEGSKDDIIT